MSHLITLATAAGPTTFESFTRSAVTIFTILGLLILAVGLIMFFVSLVANDSHIGGLGEMFTGAALFAGSFGLRALAGMAPFENDNAKGATPTTTPTPATEPPPSPPVEMDLTWLFLGLGVIAGVALLTLLVWILTIGIRHARRGIRAGRQVAAEHRASTARTAKAWQGFHAQHKELLRKILHAETDWDTLFEKPALSDPKVDETRDMYLAMRAANTQRDIAGDLPTNLPADFDLTTLPYPKAVENFAVAWDIAERNAIRLGQKKIPRAELRVIKQIRTLLHVAENKAASQTERNLAYRRAQTLIESLAHVHVPAKAMAQLEERQQLTLTAG